MTKLAKSIKNSALNLRNYPRLIGLYIAAEGSAEGINNPFFKSIGDLFGAKEGSPAKATTVGEVIVVVVEILLLVAGSIAVIFLIVGGYRYVLSHGNEEGTEAAKKTITSSVLGLVIIILAFLIVTIISRILLEGLGGLGGELTDTGTKP